MGLDGCRNKNSFSSMIFIEGKRFTQFAYDLLIPSGREYQFQFSSTMKLCRPNRKKNIQKQSAISCLHLFTLWCPKFHSGIQLTVTLSCNAPQLRFTLCSQQLINSLCVIMISCTFSSFCSFSSSTCTGSSSTRTRNRAAMNTLALVWQESAFLLFLP